jgi:hypothetical protein
LKRRRAPGREAAVSRSWPEKRVRRSKAENFRFGLNFAIAGADLERGRRRRAFSFGTYQMASIRPGNSDPIPVQASQHRVGTILIRFVGILIAAVAVMALLWSR